MTDMTTRYETRLARLGEIADCHCVPAFDVLGAPYDEITAEIFANEIEPGRYAYVTSEGTAESSYAENGNLVCRDDRGELMDLLASELDEGWAPHGRIYDLDAETFDVHGNAGVTISVKID